MDHPPVAELPPALLLHHWDADANLPAPAHPFAHGKAMNLYSRMFWVFGTPEG